MKKKNSGLSGKVKNIIDIHADDIKELKDEHAAKKEKSAEDSDNDKTTILQTMKNTFWRIFKTGAIVVCGTTSLSVIGIFVLPMVSMYIAGIMGITAESSILDVVCGWILPSLFALIMLSCGSFIICKKIAKFFGNIADKHIR